MCLTMTDPASRWFEIVELPLAKVEKTLEKIIETSEISKKIATLVNKSYSRYPLPRNITYNNVSNLNSTSETSLNQMVERTSQP